VASYGDAGTLPTGAYWAIMGGFVVVFVVAAGLILRRAARASLR
jgi:hypothetical protein